MNLSQSGSRHTSQRLSVVVGLAVLTVLAVLAWLSSHGVFAPRNRPAQIAARGTQVMPFDLAQPPHAFQPLEDGGLQAITAHDPAHHPQIALIQAHLQDEAAKCRRGEFFDPAAMHGEDMPGLATVRAGAEHLAVQDTPVPAGAHIRDTTADAALITAIHWYPVMAYSVPLGKPV